MNNNNTNKNINLDSSSLLIGDLSNVSPLKQTQHLYGLFSNGGGDGSTANLGNIGATTNTGSGFLS